jgi:hypothetical protein
VIFQECITKSMIGEGILQNEFYILSEKKNSFLILKRMKIWVIFGIEELSIPLIKRLFNFPKLDCNSCKVCNLKNILDCLLNYQIILAMNLLNSLIRMYGVPALWIHIMDINILLFLLMIILKLFDYI